MSDRLLSGAPDQLDYSGLGSFPSPGFGESPQDSYAGHYATAQGTGEMTGHQDTYTPSGGQDQGYGYGQAYGGYGTGFDGAGYDTGGAGTAWGAAPTGAAGHGYQGDGYQDPAYRQQDFPAYYPEQQSQPAEYGGYPRQSAPTNEQPQDQGLFAPSAERYGTDPYAGDSPYGDGYGTATTGYAADTYPDGAYAEGTYAGDSFGGDQAPRHDTGQFETPRFDTGQFEAVRSEWSDWSAQDATPSGGWAVEPDAFAAMETATFERAAEETGEQPAVGVWNDTACEDAPDDGPAEPAAGERAFTPRPAAVGKPLDRGRRRCPKSRRSALLSVAAPSLAVLGVTAAATAATVTNSSDPTEPPPVAAPDPSEVEEIAANEEFNTQLQGLTQAADDYADRASRTQGRMDLAAQIEAEEQAAAEEAARIEAARQKFFLPVEQRGLSAYYGQAGVNWMSTHTGIDFPVGYGTPVRAATDGVITTQSHPSYGNMMILTAPDGTETWYAHLQSTVFYSGSVQAGTVIAYSGSSGTSTGPHLHFEVRPGGGSPIDPLTWLRNQGLEPT
ncbi:Murein DD-endopeptidase MepM and murein hydrolase activator NlpD, contain LysM domain [Streptomyces zhaozhouensis]|uniref:Murein DD-endopeptidase MepM and murein hydrolase activator NlpD, contain LysM domain n=1 Tax=Streptomyces zhaozhouensis TaxID=1300267 RepID=A0A286DTG6_9ACTN|nr:M23 family metallopeptidase [Streptomyces zhaozhouensis]SOD61976.1 Murein DD-endopeptidase MepM and murein hydrolase activator NlpD, contain LysM domain [Streptomyces zhaozhouensis]